MIIKESTTAIISVSEQAMQHNGWRVMFFAEQPMAEGCDQSGVIAFQRTGMHDDRAFGYARWARDPRGDVRFFWGSYDMTREKAYAGAFSKID